MVLRFRTVGQRCYNAKGINRVHWASRRRRRRPVVGPAPASNTALWARWFVRRRSCQSTAHVCRPWHLVQPNASKQIWARKRIVRGGGGGGNTLPQQLQRPPKASILHGRRAQHQFIEKWSTNNKPCEYFCAKIIYIYNTNCSCVFLTKQ